MWCRLDSQATLDSHMSSSASEETKKIPLMYNLSIVNKILDDLKISNIPENKVKNSREVNKKISEVGQKIRNLLNMKEPIKTTGEKVMEQFVEGFDQM